MIRMNTDQSMDDLFFTFKELVDQLTCIELKFLEELFVVLILNSLPRSFREYVQSIINMDALHAIKQLKCKLLAEEMHTELEDNNINTSGSHTEEALLVSNRSKDVRNFRPSVFAERRHLLV